MKEETSVSVKLKEQFALPATVAEEIVKSFSEVAKETKRLDPEYAEIVNAKEITPEVCAAAKRVRLQYVKARTLGDSVHREIKASVLLRSNAIDGARNLFKLQITEREEPLKAIEEHFERQEQEKKAKLGAERNKALEDLMTINEEAEAALGGITAELLGEMTEEIWDNYLAGITAGYKEREDKKAAQILEDKKKEAEWKLFHKRKDELVETDLWRFLTPEQQALEYGEISDGEYVLIIKAAQAAKKKDSDKQKKLLADKKLSDKKAADAVLEADRLKKAAKKKADDEAAAKESLKKERHARRSKEVERLGIADFLAKSLSEKAWSDLSDEDWDKEVNEALGQKKEYELEKEEKATKNKKYKEWMAKNGVPENWGKTLEDDNNFRIERDGDTFRLYKLADTLEI